jgi:Fe-Mn family superoxide dismutase
MTWGQVSADWMGTGAFPHDDQRGVVLNPLLCISVQEHVWLGSGYGVWGKKEYLRRFWSAVDWERVSQSYDHWKTASVN